MDSKNSTFCRIFQGPHSCFLSLTPSLVPSFFPYPSLTPTSSRDPCHFKVIEICSTSTAFQCGWCPIWKALIGLVWEGTTITQMAHMVIPGASVGENQSDHMAKFGVRKVIAAFESRASLQEGMCHRPTLFKLLTDLLRI